MLGFCVSSTPHLPGNSQVCPAPEIWPTIRGATCSSSPSLLSALPHSLTSLPLGLFPPPRGHGRPPLSLFSLFLSLPPFLPSRYPFPVLNKAHVELSGLACLIAVHGSTTARRPGCARVSPAEAATTQGADRTPERAQKSTQKPTNVSSHAPDYACESFTQSSKYRS